MILQIKKAADEKKEREAVEAKLNRRREQTHVKGEDWRDNLNPNSLVVLRDCKLEPSLGAAQPAEQFQFERLGYFCVDTVDSSSDRPVFNRTVTLKDQWVKEQKKSR